VFGLAFQDSVAAAGSQGVGHFNTEEHTLVCGCRPRCQMTSCCCGRSSSLRRGASASSARLAPGQVSLVSGPWLGESRRSAPTVPSASPPDPSARAAVLPLEFLRRNPSSGERLLHPSCCGLPAERHSRIDRPPRA
jgi:hypothetical protein